MVRACGLFTSRQKESHRKDLSQKLKSEKEEVSLTACLELYSPRGGVRVSRKVRETVSKRDRVKEGDDLIASEAATQYRPGVTTGCRHSTNLSPVFCIN